MHEIGHLLGSRHTQWCGWKLTSNPDTFGADVAGSVVFDVRRAGVYEQAATMIPGARWRDPAEVSRWAAELNAELNAEPNVKREVVVYCVYGHEVGRATAMRLRAAGLNARFLSGGIDGWQGAGRPVAPKGGNVNPGAGS